MQTCDVCGEVFENKTYLIRQLWEGEKGSEDLQKTHTDGSEERPRIGEGVICGKLLYDHMVQRSGQRQCVTGGKCFMIIKGKQHVDLCRCNICHKYFDKLVKKNIHIQRMHIYRSEK